MCDTVVVVRPDRILFAKNSDRNPNEAQIPTWQPRTSHAAQATVRCTYLEIPQVRQTHAVMLSRPYWMWGAEIGANECGVVIGNEAVFTRQPLSDSGLTGMDLLRLALERADTATAAVETIVDLMQRFGQGGGCGHEDRSFSYHNSFIVADAGGAFVLETAGAHHAVERVEAGVRTISNGLTIPAFAQTHGDWFNTHFSRCRRRQGRTASLAAGVRSAADLASLMRDHGDGRGDEPAYDLLTGGLSAPCVHGGGLAPGAASQTTASWIAELGPDRARHWITATAAPCTSVYKPVVVDQPLDLGPEPDDQAEPVSLWWRHERLHRTLMTDPRRLLPLIRDERDALERRWFTDPEDPAAAFAEADEALARWTASVASEIGPDRRPWWARRFWAERARRSGLVPASG